MVPQPWELAIKVQLSLLGSRQCTFHGNTDEPSALPLSTTKGGSKPDFLIFGASFLISVIGNRRHLVCGLNIKSPSLQMTNRP